MSSSNTERPVPWREIRVLVLPRSVCLFPKLTLATDSKFTRGVTRVVPLDMTSVTDGALMMMLMTWLAGNAKCHLPFSVQHLDRK